MAEITYVKISELTAAGDAEVTDAGLFEMAVVDQNSDTGYTSKKVTREQVLSGLKDDLGQLSSLDTTAKSSLVAAVNEIVGEIGDVETLLAAI